MNVVFWLLIIIALVLIWFCSSFAFKAVGWIGLRLFNDVKDEITEKDKNYESKENNKNEG
jgi:hypothetical protein